MYGFSVWFVCVSYWLKGFVVLKGCTFVGFAVMLCSMFGWCLWAVMGGFGCRLLVLMVSDLYVDFD